MNAMNATHLATLLFIAGLLHLAITSAGLVMTLVLDWRRTLLPLCALTRHIIWTHGAFVLMTIIGFGVISLIAAPDLASGTTLARAFCAFVALFWLARLGVQFFVFDASPILTRMYVKLGYHGLTVVFFALVLIYGDAAYAPRGH